MILQLSENVFLLMLNYFNALILHLVELQITATYPMYKPVPCVTAIYKFDSIYNKCN